jgi:hypothetical protein
VVEVLKFLLGKERESLEETSGFWVWRGEVELEWESLGEQIIFKDMDAMEDDDEWK